MNKVAEMESTAAIDSQNGAVLAAKKFGTSRIEKNAAQAKMLRRVAASARPKIAAGQAIKKTVGERSWSIPGFGAGAKVQTTVGLTPIETLRIGDPIKTSSGQVVRVQYVDTLRLDHRFLLNHPEAQPITIPKGAFGASCPSQSISVSGGQKVKLPGRFDQKQGKEVADLIGQRRIFRNLKENFEYFVFQCGKPCTVCVDGLWIDI